jgi:hypothetical protein
MAVSSPPVRTEIQYMQALGEANRIRMARAVLKRKLKADKSLSLAISVLRDPPEYVRTMRIGDFLTALHRIGEMKAGTILNSVEASPNRSLEALTKRQRGAIADLLREIRYARHPDFPNAA